MKINNYRGIPEEITGPGPGILQGQQYMTVGNRLVVFGGHRIGQRKVQDQIWVFYIDTGIFEKLMKMEKARTMFNIIEYKGKIIIIGGEGTEKSTLKHCEKIDIND